jgi:YfiH family protein
MRLKTKTILIPDWPAPQNIQAFTTTKNTIIEELNLPSKPIYLNQVHGSHVINLDAEINILEADAVFTRNINTLCVVKSADCLPILLCDKEGSNVAAIHAGWRGLERGVIESTLQKLPVSSENLLVWLGPAIGPKVYEVGQDVREKFPHSDNAFISLSSEKYLCNLYQLAKNILKKYNIKNIYGGNFCTYSNSDLFYSYRREKNTERLLSMIWISK